MNIPEFVQIGGHTIKVIQKPFNSDNPLDERDLGYAYLVQGLIEVASTWKDINVSEDNRAMFFIHECLHHIADKWCIKISEKQVTALAQGLYQWLRDNPICFYRGYDENDSKPI